MSPSSLGPLLEQPTDQAVFDLPPIGRPRRQWPRRTLVTSAVIIVAVASTAGAGFSLWDRTTIHSGGPVLLSSGIVGQRLGVGEPTSFRGTMLMNRASEPAVLQNVRILGVTGGFEVLGVRANALPIGPGSDASPAVADNGQVLAGEHVVPGSKTRTASGESEDGLYLEIRARATTPGVARIRGVEITYRVGDRHYRRSYESPMYLCAPLEQFTIETCPGRAEGHFDDDAVVDFPVTR